MCIHIQHGAVSTLCPESPPPPGAAHPSKGKCVALHGIPYDHTICLTTYVRPEALSTNQMIREEKSGKQEAWWLLCFCLGLANLGRKGGRKGRQKEEGMGNGKARHTMADAK